MSQSVIGTIPPGGVWGGLLNRSEAIQKVASNWLKIAEQVAYG